MWNFICTLNRNKKMKEKIVRLVLQGVHMATLFAPAGFRLCLPFKGCHPNPLPWSCHGCVSAILLISNNVRSGVDCVLLIRLMMLTVNPWGTLWPHHGRCFSQIPLQEVCFLLMDRKTWPTIISKSWKPRMFAIALELNNKVSMHSILLYLLKWTAKAQPD